MEKDVTTTTPATETGASAERGASAEQGASVPPGPVTPIAPTPRDSVTPATPYSTAPSLPDPVALAQLWADQFQHLTTISVAGAAGILILMETDVSVPTPILWWLPFTFFALGAALASMGQLNVIDAASRAETRGRRARLMRHVALAAIEMGGGALMTLVWRGGALGGS